MSASKPWKPYQEQIQILKDRGLTVPDENKALQLLKHHNYYRLSAYRFPLAEEDNPDQFLSGTTFEDLWALYHFDRTLRQFVSEALKRVEISVRANWAYVLGHAYGPQSYEDPKNFRNQVRHTSALSSLDSDIKRSDEIFVKHYRKKYKTDRPPVWAVCEIMTFGVLSRFYENIAREHDKKRIAREYGLSAEMLTSLLRHGVYIRNLCAHHCRLWNRKFTVTVQLPKSEPKHVLPNLNPDEDRRLYNTIVILEHMLHVIDPSSHWGSRLLTQILTLDDKFIKHMGFPEDWRERPMWKQLLSEIK